MTKSQRPKKTLLSMTVFGRTDKNEPIKDKPDTGTWYQKLTLEDFAEPHEIAFETPGKYTLHIRAWHKDSTPVQGVVEVKAQVGHFALPLKCSHAVSHVVHYTVPL